MIPYMLCSTRSILVTSGFGGSPGIPEIRKFSGLSRPGSARASVVSARDADGAKVRLDQCRETIFGEARISSRGMQADVDRKGTYGQDLCVKSHPFSRAFGPLCLPIAWAPWDLKKQLRRLVSSEPMPRVAHAGKARLGTEGPGLAQILSRTRAICRAMRRRRTHALLLGTPCGQRCSSTRAPTHTRTLVPQPSHHASTRGARSKHPLRARTRGKQEPGRRSGDAPPRCSPCQISAVASSGHRGGGVRPPLAKWRPKMHFHAAPLAEGSGRMRDSRALAGGKR